MYGEIYTIPFKSIDEVSYKVVIEKDGFIGSSTELIGAESPFISEVSLDSPLLPLRLGSATLKIFGGDYLQNLFTPNPQGVRVKLLKNNIIEWLGFVTNDTYSQDYSNIEFVYDIELVNPLSTLKFKKFVLQDDIITIYQLIVDAIKATNSEIRKLYLPASITNTLNENIYELIFIASYNFIDEQGKEMTYYEILEHIAKYFGLTITIDKDIVYFLDYIGIGKGYNSYYGYTFNSNGTITKDITTIPLTNTNTIQTLGYTGDSSTLQINSGKNTIKVVGSLYDIDKILPDYDNEETIFHSMITEKRTVKNDGDYTAFLRFYKQPKFIYYSYLYNGTDFTTIENPYFLTTNALGAGFIRTTEFKDTDAPNQLSFTDELIVKAYNDIPSAKNGIRLHQNLKLFSMKSERRYIFHNKVHFIISMDYKVCKTMFDAEKTEVIVDESNRILPVELKINNLYYNGTNWTTTPSKFYINFKMAKGSYRYGQYYTVENKNTYDLGLGDVSGWVIKAPESITIGKVEFSIYGSPTYVYSNTDAFGDHYSFFKNIKVDYAIKDTNNIYNDWRSKDKDKGDIIYENVISDNYVDESAEIGINICSYPEQYNKLCFSTTFINDSTFQYLKYTPLNIFELPEKVLINKVINYLKDPKFEVSIPINNKVIYPYTLITDSNLAGKTFIYAGNEIDYEFERNTIKLIEI